MAAPEAIPDSERLRIWSMPFGLRGRTGHERPPERAVRVTAHAWKAVTQDASTPDQFAPGLSGLEAALVVRNLALTLATPTTPLVVASTDKAFTSSYHVLEYNLLGRWASKYPMFFEGSNSEAKPLSSRGVSTPPPRPLVYRVFDEAATQRWLSKFPSARILVFASEPAEVPMERRGRTHVVLTGLLGSDVERLGRLRMPCALQVPLPQDHVAGPNAAPPLLANAYAGSVQTSVEVVDGDDADLARVAQLYRALCRESWKEHAAFLSMARSVNLRLQADAFSGHAREDPKFGTSTDAQLVLLDALLRANHAPPRAEAHEFVGVARRAYERRKSYASPKATWLSNHLDDFEGANAPVIVADSYNVGRGRKLMPRPRSGGRRTKIVSFAELEPGAYTSVLLTAAPNARLLEKLVTGAAKDVRILLYPWEAHAFNAARGHLRRLARQVGVNDWPRLPAVQVDEAGHAHATRPVLVPTALLPARLGHVEDEAEEPEEAAGSELPAPPGLDEAEETRVLVRTETRVHVVPAERVVIALRAGQFHETAAETLRKGDVLVTTRAGGQAAAHDVIAKICAKNPIMTQTRVAAGSWRQFLREHVARAHKDKHVTEIHRALKLNISYFQFRIWLKEDEPIAPREENLVELLKALGYGTEVAELVNRAARTHRAHRRSIYHHLLNLSRANLDDIFAEARSKETLDDEYSITIEDLISVVQFETVAIVEPQHVTSR